MVCGSVPAGQGTAHGRAVLVDGMAGAAAQAGARLRFLSLFRLLRLLCHDSLLLN